MFFKSMRDIRDGIKRACKPAKIKYGRNVRDGWTLHDLRHAFTTNMRRAGVPEREIMAITGHCSRSTFDRYSKVDEADLHQAIKRLEVFSTGISKSISLDPKENPAEAGSIEINT
jgi:integrase